MSVWEKEWCRLRVFPLGTETHAREPDAGAVGAAQAPHQPWLPNPLQRGETKTFGRAPPPPTAQELQLRGAAHAVSRDESLPLCGCSALLHTSAKTEKWLFSFSITLTYVCAGDGGIVRVGGEGIRNLAKLNVL